MSGADDRRGPEGEAFWRFSLALYARPGVADALIGLQDRAGHDVNLILFGLWLGATRGQAIDAAELAAASAAIAPVGDIALRMRELRRELGAAAAPDLRALRRRVLTLELTAERRVQHRLAADCDERQPADAEQFAVAKANLALCLGRDSGSPEADVLRRELAALMRRGADLTAAPDQRV